MKTSRCLRRSRGLFRTLATWSSAIAMAALAAHAEPATNSIAQLEGKLEPVGSAERQAKAAFLLNFTRYVEWPQKSFGSSNSPFSICILGQDCFGADLQ